MKPFEDLKAPHFTVEYQGTTFTYASPKLGEASFDFLAQTIRGKDPSACRTILICQQNSEAEHLKSELAGRDVNTILLEADDPMAHQVLLLWSKGYIHQALILCDPMLNFLEGFEVNFVIHTTLPPLKKFEERLERLSKSEIKAEMLVITAQSGENEVSEIKPKADMGESPKIEVNGSPKMESKPDPEVQLPPQNKSFKDIKPVVKMDPKYLQNLSEKDIEMFKSSKDGKAQMEAFAKAVFYPSGPFSGIKDFNSPVALERIPKPLDDIQLDENKDQSSLKVDDFMEKFLKLGYVKSQNPETPNLDQEPSSLKVEENMAIMLPKCSPSKVESPPKHFPAENLSVLSSKYPTQTSEVELQSLLMACRLQSAPQGLKPVPSPPIAPIGESLSLKLPPDLGGIDDTNSLDSYQSVEDSPLASTEDSLTAGGTTVYNYGVLAWSRQVVVPCYDLGGVAGISNTLRNAIHQLGVAKSRAKAVQRFAWPHVSSGKPVIVVGNMQIGKTWCYLPIFCQRSHEELQRRPVDGHGPTSIFVCFSQSQGNQIGRWMGSLLRSLGNEVALEEVVTCWDKDKVADIACRLSQPVGILLTSVDLLLQLLSHHSKKSPIFDVRAVKYIALDNLNDMVRLLPDDTMKVLKRLPEMFDFAQNKCQLFVSGRNWLNDLMVQRILPLMPDVLILFDDALEASIYGGVELDTRIVPDEQKVKHLVAVIRDTNLAEERTVVVCSSAAEVLLLRHTLEKIGIDVQTCISEACYPQVTQWRRQSLACLLLVTDDVVTKLRCGSITLLIHYSWSTSWMRFKNRFSLFYDNYKAIPQWQRGQSVIFARETDVDAIWLMSDFLLKHGLPRPTHLLNILAQRRLAEPLHPAKLKLCHQMTAYGDCLRNSCRYRHQMWRPEVLPPDHYPTKGEIRFTVLACNSPANLSVRLNEQFPTMAHFLNVPMTNLGQQVQRHYELEENRHRHPSPVRGERAVVKNLNRYERVVILEVENSKVTVQLLDTSIEVLSYNASQVYICEKIFKDQPREAMEVRITGLEPGSLDRIWPEDVRNVVRNQFFSRTQNRRSREFFAVVQATIKDTIFVRDVYDCEGNDLRTFLTNRFRVYQEKRCLDKLIRMVQSSVPKPCPISH
ncbi:putative ATP-dependent RNA helicase SoYb [Drosophila subpulchrella]|uniref:putative ATP-dependent RNA helicase SoYb n=1 Tax=Drosophila subpulchrella TaxID=1486046 RepID=UPI0018A14983|nr:putative ATP-dependent RNA helicase SoYb [Drosophila subpulchrella]